MDYCEKDSKTFYQGIPIALVSVQTLSELSSYSGLVSAYNYKNSPERIKQKQAKYFGEPKEDEWSFENFEAIYAKGNIQDGKILIMDGRKTFYNEVRLLITPMTVELAEAIEHLKNDKSSIQYGCIVENVEDELSNFLQITLEMPKAEFQNIFNSLRSHSNELSLLLCSVVVNIPTVLPKKSISENKIYYIDDLCGPKQAFLQSITLQHGIGKGWEGLANNFYNCN